MRTTDGQDITHRDMGEWPLIDKDGKTIQVYRSRYLINKIAIYTVVPTSIENGEERLRCEIVQLAEKGFIIDEASL